MAFSANDSAPARSWRAISPSDTVNMPSGCRSLYVGGGGNLSLVGDDDNVATFTAVPAGVVLPCGPKRVNATGTSATLLLALY
jgi:hypothetical protein